MSSSSGAPESASRRFVAPRLLHSHGGVAVESVPVTAAALFGVGPGWTFSYVPATAETADRANLVERERYSASPTSAQGFWRDFGFSSGPYPGNGWTRRTWGSEARRSCSSEPLNPARKLETY